MNGKLFKMTGNLNPGKREYRTHPSHTTEYSKGRWGEE